MNNKDIARPHVEAICKALGAGFEVVSVNRCGSVDSGLRYVKDTFSVAAPELGIAKLSFTVELHNMKAMVSVDWPRDHRGTFITTASYVRREKAEELGGFPSTIGLTVTRNPEELARTIRNKLADQAKAFAPIIEKGLADWKALDESNQKAFDEIGVNFFEKSPGWSESHHERSYPFKITGTLSSKWIEVKMNESGSVGIEVSSLSQDQAVAILQTIKG